MRKALGKVKIVLLLLFIILAIGLAYILWTHGLRCLILKHENEYCQQVNPTCTYEGFDEYICKHCGNETREKFTPALGHTKLVLKEGYPSTCEKTGLTDEVICSRCETTLQKQEVIPLLDHTASVTVKGYAATCIKKGLTDEISCAVCKQIVSPQEEIACIPHMEIITKKGYDATCTQNGVADEITCNSCKKIIQQSQSIHALGHNDLDKDSLCDRCYYPTGNGVIVINSASELSQISANLEGIYLLGSDVEITGDWVPIGSDSTPFRGVLYGDGHTISGLTVNGNTLGGLFGKNNGTISNLNVSNVNITVKNKNCTIGCLAGENVGTITGCSVSGEIKIVYETNESFSSGYPLYKSKTEKYEGIFGGICAVNKGMISHCTVTAKQSMQCSNIAKHTVDEGAFYLTGGEKLVVTDNVYYGGIAGKNQGTIDDCRNTGNCSADVKANASLGKKHGMCQALTETYLGSIVGLNAKQITNCQGTKLAIRQDVNENYVFSSNLQDQGHIAKITVHDESDFSGIIGLNNKGTLNNVTYNQI